MLPQLVSLVNTIHVLVIFSYIFRTDNLLYILTSPPGHLQYSGLPQTSDELQCLGVFPFCGYNMEAPIVYPPISYSHYKF